jgi:DNA-binding SARP family transcriptional activator
MAQTPSNDPKVPPTLLRISTLGPFSIEYRDPHTRAFMPLPKEKWHGKGATPALSLLKLLISQPHRYAPQDWILEQFWPETEVVKAESRLHDASYFLRSLLHPFTSEQDPFFWYVRHTKTGGGGYRLAQHPLIWIDADAFTWYMAAAALHERMGDDPFPFLEKAYHLGARGTFLVEEVYSQWAQARRQELDGAFRLCVHQLGGHSLEKRDFIQAETFVRSYWVNHMTDEDALRLLMNILGEQGRYQEAYACYEQTREQREQAEESIDPRTHDLAQYWRTKPLSRSAKSDPRSVQASPSQLASLLTPENVIQFLQVIQAQWPKTVSNGEALSVLSESDAPLVIVVTTPGSSPTIPSSDLGTWLSHKANELRAIGTSGLPITNQQRQADVHTGIESWNRMVDQNHPQRKEFLSTRRTVLTDLALVSASILGWMQSGKMTAFMAKEFLAECATSLTACYHLLKRDGFLPVEYALSQYLPHLIVLGKSPSSFQKEAASLASQACCLMGLTKFHLLQFHEQARYCEQGVELAQVTGDSVLIAISLTLLGNARGDSHQPQKRLEAYQEAERLLPKEPELLQLFPPRLRSSIYIGLSNAHAFLGHVQDAQYYLGLANEISLRLDDGLFIPSLDYDLSEKIAMEGYVHTDLGNVKDKSDLPAEAYSHYQDADAALAQSEQLLQSTAPQRVWVEIIIQRAGIAIKLGNMENLVEFLKEGSEGAKALGSQRRQEEAKVVWRAGMERWPHEQQVIKLWEWVL